MRIVLLPIKDFNDAKQRLAGALAPEHRAALARAMLSDVLGAISRARSPQRVIVFTASAEVAEVVRPFSFEIVEEILVRGHSTAVNGMVEQLSGAGSKILAIAGDLPTLRAEDIDLLLDSTVKPRRRSSSSRRVMVRARTRRCSFCLRAFRWSTAKAVCSVTFRERKLLA